MRLKKSEASVRARFMSDEDIPSLARLKKLRRLDFSSGSAVGLARITDEGLSRLSGIDLPLLEQLDLGHCAGITDAGLAHAGTMHQVSYLSLMACARITDAGLSHLMGMRNLTGLDLRGCDGITDRGLQTLATKIGWHRILLGGCKNITADGVARLQTTAPNADVAKDEVEWGYHAAEAK